jgi:hypothetical protein
MGRAAARRSARSSGPSFQNVLAAGGWCQARSHNSAQGLNNARLGQCSGMTPSGRGSLSTRAYLLALFVLIAFPVGREVLLRELFWRKLLARVVHDAIGPREPAIETPERPVDALKDLQRIEATRVRGLSPGPVFRNDP